MSSSFSCVPDYRPSRLVRSQRRQRKGVAAVEVLPCLLLMMTITFGTLETCAGLLIQQSLTVSAFEGVRAGVGRGTTNEDILTRVRQVLEFRQITLGNGSTTEFASAGAQHGIFLIIPDDDDDPTTVRNVEDLDALDPITIRIVAPSAGNATPMFKHLLNRDIIASVTMVREFDTPVSLNVDE